MSTITPFLYQTRTLQVVLRTRFLLTHRVFSHVAKGRSRERPRASDFQATSRDPIPFELPDGVEDPDLAQQEALERALKGAEADAEFGSTITPSERKAFTRIFEEIAVRDSARFRQPVHPAVHPAVTRNAVNVIMQDAATQGKGKQLGGFEPLSPIEQTAVAEDKIKALLRFPPSLRQAARQALRIMHQDGEKADSVQKANGGQADDTESEDGSCSADGSASDLTSRALNMLDHDFALDPLAQKIKVEALQYPERSRIEAKMSKVKNDFELWDVMEEEVFTMVRRLGIGDADAAETGGGTTDAETSAEKRPEGDGDGDAKLSLRMHGPLYPACLLDCLRRLDQAFERSSPLVFSVLPRVKQLGLMSYVIGISTPFYNELMSIHWHRYGDITSVLNLLEEARHVGLYLDSGTLSILHSILRELDLAKLGDSGPFLKELVTQPEYADVIETRLKHWHKQIYISMAEKDRDLDGEQIHVS